MHCPFCFAILVGGRCATCSPTRGIPAAVILAGGISRHGSSCSCCSCVPGLALDERPSPFTLAEIETHERVIAARYPHATLDRVWLRNRALVELRGKAAA